MNNFTFEEKNLVCIYSGDNSRLETIAALKEMRNYLETDEVELLELTDSAIAKLNQMSDSEFSALDWIPDFTPEDFACGE